MCWKIQRASSLLWTKELQDFSRYRTPVQHGVNLYRLKQPLLLLVSGNVNRFVGSGIPHRLGSLVAPVFYISISIMMSHGKLLRIDLQTGLKLKGLSSFVERAYLLCWWIHHWDLETHKHTNTKVPWPPGLWHACKGVLWGVILNIVILSSHSAIFPTVAWIWSR